MPIWFSQLTPISFVIQSIFIIALILIILASLGNLRFLGMETRGVKHNFYQEWLASERKTSKEIGLTFQRWMALRAVVLVAGIGIGLWTSIPILMVLGLGLGLFALKWGFAQRVGKKQLQLDRAFLEQIRTLRDRIDKGISLDVSIVDMAVHAPDDLKELFSPLLKEGPLSQRLANVAALTDAPLVGQICSTLIIARSYDPGALLPVLNGNLLPLGASHLEIEEDLLSASSQQRGYVYVMSLLIGGMLLFSISNTVYQTAYSTFTGQIALAVDALAFMGIIWLVGKLLGVSPLGKIKASSVYQAFGGSVNA